MTSAGPPGGVLFIIQYLWNDSSLVFPIACSLSLPYDGCNPVDFVDFCIFSRDDARVVADDQDLLERDCPAYGSLSRKSVASTPVGRKGDKIEN